MITADQFALLRAELGEVAEADIAWAESVTDPRDEDAFALEAIFVICNSGMKNTVARLIFEKVRAALMNDRATFEVFRHPGKAAAIDHIWRNRGVFFIDYHVAEDKLAYLETLPWIGGITKYHLAKNFGLPFAKPDVHLQRLADREETTPQELCERLAAQTGLCVNAVDTVLWRACANGILNSRTGDMAT
jgi:hypothetical protein